MACLWTMEETWDSKPTETREELHKVFLNITTTTKKTSAVILRFQMGKMVSGIVSYFRNIADNQITM